MTLKEKDRMKTSKGQSSIWKMVVLAGVLLAGCGVNFLSPAQDSQASEGNYQIELTTDPSPLTTGDVTFIVTLKDKQDALVEGADVNVSYAMTTVSMGVISGKATDEGKGVYTVKSNLSHGGGLKVMVSAERSDLGKGVRDFQIDIK
jgi:hypothetical protein